MTIQPGIPRPMSASQVEMTELVLPHHTNQLGNLMGGQIMHWMDIACAMAAIRHSGLVCVTAGVDEINFLEPIRLGDIVILKATVNRTFSTSMEVGVKVFRQQRSGELVHANTAFFTFVGLGEESKPVAAPAVLPENDKQRRWHEEALLRRSTRLAHRNEPKPWKGQH
jgi:acyl-CoA hydrolase